MKDITIERYGALHLAANLTADGLPARIEGEERESVHRAGEGARGAHQGAAAPAHRQLVPDLAGLELSASSGAGTAACCRRRNAPMSPNKIDAVDAILLALSGAAGDADRAGLRTEHLHSWRRDGTTPR